MHRTCPAWPAKTKLRMTLNWSRIEKEITMMSGILARAGSRRCFIPSRGKNKKDHKKLRRKLVDYCLKQCETGRSQAANLETQKQTKWIKMHQSQVNMCFLRGPLRWLTEQKHPKFLWGLQNSQCDTTNLANIMTPYSVSQQTVSLLHVFD